MSGLNSYPLIAFVGTTDMAEAKTFYRDRLGLNLAHDDGFACIFDVHGTMLRVVAVGQLTPAPYTVLGWDVPHIATAVRELEEAGISTERFPGLEQDEMGIWTAPGGAAQVAWFKDPAGNVLSVSQH